MCSASVDMMINDQRPKKKQQTETKKGKKLSIFQALHHQVKCYRIDDTDCIIEKSY